MKHAPCLLPHVRVELLVHTICPTTWDATTWAIVRREVPRVLAIAAIAIIALVILVAAALRFAL